MVGHFLEVIEQLTRHNGLNYAPREISKNGRVFEHAADSRVLIDHLSQLNDGKHRRPMEEGGITYYVKIVDEVSSSKDVKVEEA